MKKIILTIFSAALFVSCSDDYLDKAPQNNISNEQIQDVILNYPEKAMTIIEGAESGNNRYLIEFGTADLGNLHDDFGYMSIKLGLDHMTNDLVLVSSNWFLHYYNFTGRQENSARTQIVWNFYYKVIYNMNSVLSLLPDNSQDANIQYVKGRALAMRAQAYLDLIRIYGNGDLGIPYYSQDVYDTSRVPTQRVYELIEQDLLDSYELLGSFSTTDKQMITKEVVAGFLSRLYLTTNKYSEAATYARLARQGRVPMSASELAGGFSDISNSEWMWGADINGSTTTSYASFFSHMDNTNEGYAGLLLAYKSIDKRLYDQIPSSDLRKKWFTDTVNDYGLPKYANVKFIDPTFMLGDYVFMRVGEMYFNEAEALALSGNDAQAKQVLFEIMSKRDPQYVLSTKTGADLLNEIRLNRRIELWGEGNSFYDMKRWGMALERDYTGTNHPLFGRYNYPAGSTKFNFQIPVAEIRTNTSIVSQNPL